MATSITTALSSFAQALSNVGFAILNAAVAVFNAILALFSEIAMGVLQVAQALIKLVTDLVQDTVGFLFGEPIDAVNSEMLLTFSQRTSSSFSSLVARTIGTQIMVRGHGAPDKERRRLCDFGTSTTVIPSDGADRASDSICPLSVL